MFLDIITRKRFNFVTGLFLWIRDPTGNALQFMELNIIELDLIYCEDFVVLKGSNTCTNELRARTSVLDTCKLENVTDSWAARDSVESGSDSSGNDTSDCGAVSTLILLGLLYADACNKWSFSSPCCMVCLVFCLVAFFDRGTTFGQPQ